MANNLTGQVRNIAEVTIAVANGDLSKKITPSTVRGEILQLKEAINTHGGPAALVRFEVTRVARESAPMASSAARHRARRRRTWKDLTDLRERDGAANLTAQVRSIRNVTTAVARGDLSRKITVDVRGEFWS